MLLILPHLVIQLYTTHTSTNMSNLCMKSAIAPPQMEKTMTRMTTSSGLTRVPLVEIVTEQLEVEGTGKSQEFKNQE